MKSACCRKGHAAGAVVSGIALALVPKCPMCVAGYVALFTGIGISTASAGWLRAGLIAMCLAILALFCWKSLRRKT